MHKIALIHASRAAVGLVMSYYSHSAPGLEFTNLLDDGLMRLLGSGRSAQATQRLAEMLSAARDTYGAEAALLTCSAIPPAAMAELRHGAGIAVVKIDEPMCHAAVECGSNIGILVSFPPTGAATRELLSEAAARGGKQIRIVEEQAPEALQTLLDGDETMHEDLLLAAADRLSRQKPDAILLTQVSMARQAPRLTARLGIPVFSSLASSLDALRAVLNP